MSRPIVIRALGVLFRLLPRSMREHHDEMLEQLEWLFHHAPRRGATAIPVLGTLALSARATWDIVAAAPRAHLRNRQRARAFVATLQHPSYSETLMRDSFARDLR